MPPATRKPRRLPPIQAERARQEAEKQRRLEAKKQARPATSDHAREFRARVANASAKVDDRNSWQPVRAQTAPSEPSPMRRLMDRLRGGRDGTEGKHQLTAEADGTGGGRDGADGKRQLTERGDCAADGRDGTGFKRQLTVEVDAAVAPPAESPLLSALRSATRSIRRAWGGGGERRADGSVAETRSPGRRWLQRGDSGRSSRASRGDGDGARDRSSEGGSGGAAAAPDGRAILDAWKQEDSLKQRRSFGKFMRGGGIDSGRAEPEAVAVEATLVPQAPEGTPPAKAKGKNVTGLGRFRRFRLTQEPLTNSEMERMKGPSSPVRCAGTVGHDAAQVRGGQVVEGDRRV